MEPPGRGPVFFMSAIPDFIPSKYFSSIGSRQIFSPALSAAVSNSLAKASSGVNKPAISSPKAITQAPVRVAKSTIASTPSLSANTKASARVKRPSASVLFTSIVLPLDALRISPGCMAWPLIIFSVTAEMK